MRAWTESQGKKGGQPLTDVEEFDLKACECIAKQTVKISQNRVQLIIDAQAEIIERKRYHEENLKLRKEAECKRKEDAEFRRKQDEAAKTFAEEACVEKRHIIQDALSKFVLRFSLKRSVAV